MKEAGTVNRMIVEFPAKQWKWRVLFDLVQRSDSTGSAERLSGSDRRHRRLVISIIVLIQTVS